MARRGWTTSAATVASAVLLAIPYVAPSLALLTLVGLIPFFVVIINSPSPKAAWKQGYLFGAVTLGFQIIFFYTLTARWTGSIFLGLLPWLGGVALGSCYYGLLGWGFRRLFQRRWYWAVPMTWAGLEVVRSYIPVLAFPWGLLGTPLVDIPWLVHFAHWFTIFGAAAWVASIAVVIAGLIGSSTNEERGLLGIPAVMVVLPLFLDFVYLGGPTKPMKILLNQPGVDTGFIPADQARRQLGQDALDTLQLASREGADLTVFPEGFTRIASTSHLDPGFPLDPSTPVIFGAQRGTEVIHQSAFSFDGQWHWSDKTRLVLFGEYVPGRDVLPLLSKFNLPSADIVPGTTNSILPVARIKVGPILCFEALFPDIPWRLAGKGAQLLCIISDDAWFTGSPAPVQLNQATAWRAIETGLPAVRSGMTGFTDSVDANGYVTHELPFGPPGNLTVTVQVPVSPTKPWWLPIFPAAALLSLGLWIPKP